MKIAENNFKTPVTYYGGKQRLASKIISRIPTHKLYCEPFVGGAAVFFAKPQSEMEVLNDTNTELINFYRILQNRFVELESMVKVTLHSRKSHHDANVIYANPHLFSEIQRAWAVWVLSTQSFSAMFDGSWGYDKARNTTTKKIIRKRNEFNCQLSIRIQNVQLECADALYIIKSRDTAQSFFYCDPPYYNSDCGHYNGYNEQDFINLLELLTKIKGKFLLSSYPSLSLSNFIKRNKWQSEDFNQTVSVAAKSGHHKLKTEVLTRNYKI